MESVPAPSRAGSPMIRTPLTSRNGSPEALVRPEKMVQPLENEVPTPPVHCEVALLVVAVVDTTTKKTTGASGSD